LGVAFVFGGIIYLLMLYHMICANYYLFYENNSEVNMLSSNQRATVENYLIAAMILAQITLIAAVLILGGIGSFFLGVSKIIEIVMM
jgi:hypothetical protein